MSLKQELQDTVDKADWEGGLDELLLSYASADWFSFHPELHVLAKEAAQSWEKFATRFSELCEENEVEY